jgi:hypothetical protein
MQKKDVLREVVFATGTVRGYTLPVLLYAREEDLDRKQILKACKIFTFSEDELGLIGAGLMFHWSNRSQNRYLVAHGIANAFTIVVAHLSLADDRPPRAPSGAYPGF